MLSLSAAPFDPFAHAARLPSRRRPGRRRAAALVFGQPLGPACGLFPALPLQAYLHFFGLAHYLAAADTSQLIVDLIGLLAR